VPNVHLRVVENVFQRPEWQVNIGVVEVTDHDGEQVHQQEILDTKTDHRQRHILDAAVHDGFSKMVTQVGRVAHFTHGMVYFMHLPEEWDFVQQAVGVPLYKIAHQKQNQQLHPVRDLRHMLMATRLRMPNVLAKKSLNACETTLDISGISYQPKQEKVEEHVKRVQPKILSNFRLVFAPREQQFQAHTRGGKSQ
jgi:hypothetical protein